MSDLWKTLEACIRAKMLVRFAALPGGNISIAIYNSPDESQQYLYESKTGDMDQLNHDVLKDWRHLLGSTTSFPSLAGFPKL